MPERLDFEALRRAAVDQIDRLVAEEWRGARVADIPEGLRGRFGGQGWQITVEFPDASLDLLLLVDSEFPFSLPRVAVANGPDLLSWPHLERDGLLCSLPSIASVDFTRPEDVVRQVMTATCELIEQNLSALPTEDFRNEFLSYWSYDIGAGARDGVSVVRPGAPSRRIWVWRGRNNWYFGDGPTELQGWLSNRFSTAADKYDPEPAWLLWLPEPWTPDEYPNSGEELLASIANNESDLKELDRLLVDQKTLVVLAGARSESGFCFGALSIRGPDKPKHGWAQRGAGQVTKGFRPGRVPGRIVRNRFFGRGGRLTRHRVSRADPSWIHGRDQNEQLSELQGQEVVIVGVGSLGSAVARLLCQAGADRLTLIDPEQLEWANVGRHELGAGSVGSPKACELASTLRRRFPHVSVKAHDAILGAGRPDLVEEVLSSRLVTMLTGSWTLQAYLNLRWLERTDAPELVLGWMEPHALAAHSVHLTRSPFEGCLHCGLDPLGRPKLQVIDWQTDQTREIPACGGTFMPYGAVDLSVAAALVVEHCVDALGGRSGTPSRHRIWVASRERVATAGGSWSPEWIQIVGDPSEGSRLVTRSWTRASGCPSCGALS